MGAFAPLLIDIPTFDIFGFLNCLFYDNFWFYFILPASDTFSMGAHAHGYPNEKIFSNNNSWFYRTIKSFNKLLHRKLIANRVINVLCLKKKKPVEIISLKMSFHSSNYKLNH